MVGSGVQDLRYDSKRYVSLACVLILDQAPSTSQQQSIMKNISFSDLDDDVVIHVCKFLEIPSILCLRQVSCGRDPLVLESITDLVNTDFEPFSHHH